MADVVLMQNRRDGVLVLNKPAGISSRAALDRICSMLPGRKMGHAGTLDPLASGVLVVCIGKATRLIPFVQRMVKEYIVTLRLGQCSDTHDLEGNVADVPGAVSVERDTFEACLAAYRGTVMQIPPQHSAVHVRGKRAYELARAGASFELASRPVTIEHCTCTRFEYPEADLEIRCGAGTYVRSIVRDIGNELGTGAVMTQLVRSAVGHFRLDDSLQLDEPKLSDVLQHLRPIQEALPQLPRCTVPTSQVEDVRHGRTIRLVAHRLVVGECALINADGELLAIGEVDCAGHFVHPRIVVCCE
jgi:tRNA pseudouridine55 synthase